jgi:hypothetical protein
VIAQRILALALLSCVLIACGGGGGGNDGGTGGTGNPPPTTPPGGGSPNNPPPPPPDPVDWEQHSAEHARVRMLLNGTVLAIEWTDLFDNELGFQVERRVGAGSWEIVESLPAMSGGSGFWSRSVPIAASYRLTATLQGRSMPLHSPGNETEIAIDPAPSNPATIQIDQAEPVRGDLQVSLQNAGPAIAVIYTFEGAALARVTSGETFAATLPAQHLVDGRRELHAFIEKTPGLTLGYQRILQVDNPAPAVVFFFASTYPSGTTHINAKASSDAGITSVEFFVNGASVHVASAPVPGTDQYNYPVDISTLQPGTYVFRVVATDSTTATVAMERTYTVNAAPTLNVTGLFDGMIVSGDSVMIIFPENDRMHVSSAAGG